MVPLRPFIRSHDGSLDQDTTRIMGAAFEAACALFCGLSKNEREAVADRIVAEARNGERDPIRCAMLEWPR